MSMRGALAVLLACGLPRAAGLQRAARTNSPLAAARRSSANVRLTLAADVAAPAAVPPQFSTGSASSAKLGVLLLSQGAPDSVVDLESYLCAPPLPAARCPLVTCPGRASFVCRPSALTT
ncbi:hypothetical protein T492DRAFT_856140 [Pavlovales sp. CCMP2436]|nr:hypothetical protein T492DRAFT_856140 [Pavlovales sp. CCMP2436]